MKKVSPKENLIAIKKKVNQIEQLLAKWKPYRFSEAKTGSIYLKFPHWGLGSIRFGDHRGRKQYHYRWIWMYDGEVWAYSVRNQIGGEDPREFVQRFEAAAAERGINPGDAQTWEEFKGIPVPEHKAKGYAKAKKGSS